jgi:hypothetical protein
MDMIMAGPGGHILAAAMRQDSSGPQPDAAALVGDGLMIRDPVSGDTLLTVASAHLSAQWTDDVRDDVLMSARDFLLSDGLPEKGGDPHVTPVVLNGSTITVNIPVGNPASVSTVWVYVEGAAQPIVQQVQIDKSAVMAVEQLVLASGNYCALVLAPGRTAAIVKATIP